MAGPDRKLSDIPFCALDIETTGVNSALHRIVEVGMVRFTLDEIEAPFECLVNPGMKIPAEIVGIHGITDEMVANAPRIEEILDAVSAKLHDCVLVIHNPGFDLSFLSRAYQISGMQVPAMVAVDTVRMSRRAFADIQNCKLDTICAHLGLDLSHHRALSDATGCMEIFRRIIKKEDPDGAWRLSDLTAYHGGLIRAKKISFKRITDFGKRIMGIQLGRNVGIKYMDHAGTVTTRTIHPREFITYRGETYVLAFCYLRNDMRYFNINRIVMIETV
jgi:DNA polymerase III epsilon subunit family exonuclease